MSAHGFVPLGPDATGQGRVREPAWTGWRAGLLRVVGVLMVTLSVVPVAGLLAVPWLTRRRHPATLWALLIAAESFVASVWVLAALLQ